MLDIAVQRSGFICALVLTPRRIPLPAFVPLVTFRAPSSPQLPILPQGPSVHTIAVDQNDGQHVILAQHSRGRVPAGLRRLVL